MLAIGSQGDVQPLVALGLGLKSAGYDITIATHKMFEKFVRSNGLEFKLIQVNPRESLNLGERIQGEDGVTVAIEEIEKFFSKVY